MLDSFRKASKSWPIKILFVFLIASFGIWGIGDVVRQRASSQPAIVVGKQEIGAPEVVEEFRRDTERMQQMFGGKLTLEQARQFGLLQRTIEQIINRTLLDQAAEDLGFTVDDDSLRRMIAAEPAFQNQDKVFDKGVYLRTLSRVGYTEKAYLRDQRGNAVREQLVRLVSGGVREPAIQADPVFRYRMEQRVAETVTFPADKMPAPAKPTEDALKAYYKDHSAQFMAPEMRGLTAVVIRTDDVAAEIKPSEEDIAKAYQIRQAEFQTPDRRAIQQVLFADEAKAKTFADSVKTGKDFAAAAKASGGAVQDLGMIDAKSLPLPEMAKAVFGLPADGTGVAGPLQSPLGWHVLRVTAAIPSSVKTLAEVRPLLVQGLVKDEALNRLYALSTKLEDSLGSGAALDEAAAAVNRKPLKVAAIDERGQGLDGKPVPGLPASGAFMTAAFATAQGATSDVTQLEDNAGYFVLHVDGVTPPALKPQEAVKDQVLAGWTQEQKEQAARKLAETAAERLRKGEPLSAVAGTFKVETTKPFRRSPTEKSPESPLLVAEMFKAQPGGVTVVVLPGASQVARLKEVVAADPRASAALFEQGRKQLAQAISGDLVQQYVASLEKDYGVAIHSAAIDRQFGEK